MSSPATLAWLFSDEWMIYTNVVLGLSLLDMLANVSYWVANPTEVVFDLTLASLGKLANKLALACVDSRVSFLLYSAP